MKCCMHYHSMGIIKIYFGKSQENLKKTFLVGLLQQKGLSLKDGPSNIASEKKRGIMGCGTSHDRSVF